MINDFEKREITFEGTTFFIGKMLPIEAEKLLVQHIRPLFRGGLSAPADAPGVMVLFAAITDAPYDNYVIIQNELFKNIEYSKGHDGGRMPLFNDQENAFDGLEGIHRTLLTARAFVVNFTGFWSVLKSEHPELVEAVKKMFTPDE